MKVLVAKITLVIPHSNSLKDKRRIVKAIKDRVWTRFRAAISEIEDNGAIKKAVLGVVCVANDAQILDSIINKIINLVEESYPGLLHDYVTTIETY